MTRPTRSGFSSQPLSPTESDALGEMLSVLRKVEEMAAALTAPGGGMRRPVAVRAAAAGVAGRRKGGGR